MSGDDTDPAPLSIVCVIHSLDGGGAERVMAGLVTDLSSRGHRVVLVTFDDGTRDRYAVGPSVQRRALDFSTGATRLTDKIRQVRNRHRKIASTVRELCPDVVLSFCDRTNIDVLLACNRASLPLVISERSDPARQSLGPFWDSVRRRVYRRASAVIALTETAAKHLRPFSRSVHVVHSAIDAPPLLSNREQASRRKVIVGAGRLEQEKGFDRLLKAFAKATDDAPDWQLVIYGEGSQHKQLVRQASILGIQDRVDFPGWVRPLAEPLSEATLFCLSSRYEGFPSVLLEAMSMGVPVISVDCESGPRVIVDHGRNGLLVDPSVDGLAEGMTRLIKDRAERERLGREGKSVVEQFKWETMVDRYEAILRNAATQT